MGRDLVVVVADGAGGLRGGAEAADLLVKAVRSKMEDRSFAVHDARSWMSTFKATDAKLFVRRAGETTGVVVVVGAGRLLGVSVGDSEGWIIDSTSIDRLTERQEKARLGSGRIVPVSFQRFALEGCLVVATDGLFKYAPAEEIAATLREGGDVATVTRRLAGLPRTPAGTYQDDLAVVVVGLR